MFLKGCPVFKDTLALYAFVRLHRPVTTHDVIIQIKLSLKKLAALGAPNRFEFTIVVLKFPFMGE